MGFEHGILNLAQSHARTLLRNVIDENDRVA